jgi:hypothetical protein
MRLCVGGCGRELVPARVWSTLTPEQRADLRPVMARSQARGLCAACYQSVARSDLLIDYAPVRRPVAETMEDWYEHRDATRSIRREVVNLAPRLGMKPAALRRAVWRASRMDAAS